ncbi:MAG: sulfotransferase, partial [Acidimicrobiales bacterium]
MIHPVAITGMHRSGTSMITRALHDSGLHLVGTGAEDLLDPAEDNPEGFWENKAIVAANEDLLEACGGSWDNPPDLPPQSVDDPRVAHVADAASAALDGLREHEQWGFKDPRACLTAAYWLDLEPELRFIICVRHPLEVALSLKRRNQNSYSLGLALWERYYATVLDQVPAERRIVTHYDTFFVDPEGEAARLCAFAGLVPAPPSVRSDLRHHTIDVDLGDAGASRSLRALYADLCRTAGAPPPRDTTADEGRVRRLILDGAVAQRHADQRQDAIDRLEEREVQFRAEHTSAQEELRQRMRDLERQRAALEAEHRSTVRDLERQRTRELERQRAALEAAHRSTVRDLERELASTRQEAVARLAALQQETSTALGELQTSLARIDQRTAATASRLEVVVAAVEPTPLRRALRRASARAVRGGRRYLAPGRRVLSRGQQALAPAARTAAHKLPPPAQDTLRRGRVVLKRGVDQPAPTAKAVGRKAVHSARLQVHHLPPPAQQALRRGRTLYRRT